MKRNFVVAITGASGVTYAVRLLEVLTTAGCDVHLMISEAAKTVLKKELNLTVDLDHFDLAKLLLDSGTDAKDEVASGEPGKIRYHHYQDLTAPVASGSFLTDGMIVCPCSGTTLSAIVHGVNLNLIHRAAEVHLKENRKLILVPRETPLSRLRLDSMKRAAEAGAVILPAMPGFYHGVTSIQDLVDFVVARICDQLGIENSLIERWEE
jgi:4-hydroxy-3-polyprenylbenzoate decarboxylase